MNYNVLENNEEESDSIYFELGFRSIYTMITDYISTVVEVADE